MKAKELAEQLLKNPDFDIVFNVTEKTEDFGGYIKNFENIKIIDIGYSDKIILLGGEEY